MEGGTVGHMDSQHENSKQVGRSSCIPTSQCHGLTRLSTNFLQNLNTNDGPKKETGTHILTNRQRKYSHPSTPTIDGCVGNFTSFWSISVISVSCLWRALLAMRHGLGLDKILPPAGLEPTTLSSKTVRRASNMATRTLFNMWQVTIIILFLESAFYALHFPTQTVSRETCEKNISFPLLVLIKYGFICSD